MVYCYFTIVLELYVIFARHSGGVIRLIIISCFCVYFMHLLASSCVEVFCKKCILEILQNSQENTKRETKTPVQVFSCEFCKIYKNSFSYRIPPLATSNR